MYPIKIKELEFINKTNEQRKEAKRIDEGNEQTKGIK